MLQIKEIRKKYITGELEQTALDGVSLSLRDNEFVAVLGPSGSGKTTLLNIVGGLDRYDEGDLIINSISTRKYKDRDWDSYRNHSIGFVFQSYNLIPHLSVLANVELALTISGIPAGERKRRAKDAMEKVGLGDQLHKKPNQMSGGQMQRVAIARALVNDPSILLADEPTGALDSATSVQVLDLLKKVAKDRLVIMVTHNAELAKQYATRIVRLRDGRVTDDSDPYGAEESPTLPIYKNMGKAAMSFFTSLSLSFHNLRTKKGRTILTAFAGSIGIIGIALILSLSTGVNKYISDIQRDTMASYPITISAETVDLGSMMSMHGPPAPGMQGALSGRSEGSSETLTGVYSDSSELASGEAIASSIMENDLTAFKKYLDDPNSEIHRYLGENGVVYAYDVRFNVYSYSPDGTLINTNADTDEAAGSSGFGGMMPGGAAGVPSIFGGAASASGAENFEELMPGSGGEAVSQVITDSYETLYGRLPQSYDEVVLVLDEKNAVPTSALYQLGLITAAEYTDIIGKIRNGEDVGKMSWDYAEICAHTFHLVPASDSYIQNEDGTFAYIGDNLLYNNELMNNSLELKVAGVIRPAPDAANAVISSPVAYTSALTDYVVDHTNHSAIVLAQENSPEVNVVTGMKFEAADDAAKIADAKEYISGMNISDKASLYTMILYYSSSEGSAEDGEASGRQPPSGTAYPAGASGPAGPGMTDEASMAAAMDAWLSGTPDEDFLLSIYDEYISGGSYEENMADFGKVSYDAPYSISLYADSFEDKDAIAESITNYNRTVGEDSRITYTDYVALLTSSITSIIDVISYVLIAFVAVSLVVSCIMIGIITHISVLERTKEIGILRALGASKRNISQVFNAETIIIGLCAGLLGVGISLLLLIPINAVIGILLGAVTLSAALPVSYAVMLILLSMAITVVGGLLPARNAAKKDPVIALRTE